MDFLAAGVPSPIETNGRSDAPSSRHRSYCRQSDGSDDGEASTSTSTVASTPSPSMTFRNGTNSAPGAFAASTPVIWIDGNWRGDTVGRA